MSFLSKKQKTSDAFAFGEECVRFISLQESDQGIRVAHHETVRLSGIVDTGGAILEDAQFVEKMREFAKVRKIENANCVVPDAAAIFFHTHVARVPAKQLNDVVTDHLKTYCEAHDLLGFDDYVCEYDVIREGESGYDLHVTLVAKSVVVHIARLFKQAGVTIKHVETANHAVAKACTGVPTGQGYIAVSVGENKTSISVVHGYHPVSNDVISVGNNSIINAVEERLRISHVDASKIVEKHGVMGSHPDTTVLSDIHRALAPIVESIDRQILAVKQKEYKLFGERFSIDKIVVYGIGLSTRGLADYLGTAARLPVVALDVWAASGAKHIPIMSLPASDVPQYAEALSLALVYLKK
ncbi:MAG: hypothetical protein JWM20_619 [Patescibacteria group bacterium]|nr:hypothetical protein [Patescibacteria group bacterium]